VPRAYAYALPHGVYQIDWKASWKGHPVHISSSGLRRGFEVDIAGKVALERAITVTGSGRWEGDVDVDGRNVHVAVEILGSFTDSECELWIDGDKIALETVA
jgi:hypothetical protein